MKLLSLLFLVGVVLTGAVRADEGAYQENRLDVLHYRVPSAIFGLGVSVTPDLHDATTSYPGGSATYDDARTGFSSGVGLSFGVTDQLLVTLSESYLSLTRNSLYDPAGTTTTYQTQGFSDPTVQINFRYFGELTGRDFASAFVAVTPGIGNAQIATSTLSGNNISADTGVEFGTHYYHVAGIQEFGLEASLTYRTSGTFSDPTGFPLESNSSYWVADISAYYRIHFLDRFFLGASLELIPAHSIQYAILNAVPAVSEQDSYPWWISESVELGWLVTPALLVDATYSYSAYTETISYGSQASYLYTLNEDRLILAASLAF